jgi:hypothetical protein
LQVAFDPIVAYNLLLLSSFAIGGLGAYLLCLDVLRRVVGADAMRSRSGRAAALLGGLLYAFAAPKLFYAALGQGNIASSQWIPFAVLYIVRTALPDGRPRDAAMAALFIALQAYAELTYATFLALFAALAALWGLIGIFTASPRSRRPPVSALFGRFTHRPSHRIGAPAVLANMLRSRAEAAFSPQAVDSPTCSPLTWRATSSDSASSGVRWGNSRHRQRLSRPMATARRQGTADLCRLCGSDAARPGTDTNGAISPRCECLDARS